MKVSELMIGDWVECVDPVDKKKEYAQIAAIEEGKTIILVRHDNYSWFLDIYFIKPIPLTREILEKNGFVNDYSIFKVLSIMRRFIVVDILGDIGYLQDADLKYVHQLQNAIRICGIKKEIVL